MTLFTFPFFFFFFFFSFWCHGKCLYSFALYCHLCYFRFTIYHNYNLGCSNTCWRRRLLHPGLSLNPVFGLADLWSLHPEHINRVPRPQAQLCRNSSSLQLTIDGTKLEVWSVCRTTCVISAKSGLTDTGRCLLWRGGCQLIVLEREQEALCWRPF